LSQRPLCNRHARREYPLSAQCLILNRQSQTKPGRGTENRFEAVVARRLGLFSSSEKRPLTRSSGVVRSSATMVVVFSPRKCVVIYVNPVKEGANMANKGGCRGGAVGR
jgi:hypothetical protein